ncbi:hypothetical protein ACNJKD_09880 [Edwardsiella tarda]|uniref:hypothetical protein n=1 Tax=Edwardsiella tarda TaxID=636 RepID=UPI003A8A0998
MSNVFDFEVVANDQVSDAIDRINEAIRELEPRLDKTREGLQLGGQETVDGLNGFISRFENLSKTARDNVQLIGDMVPPLKMVGEISGKLGSLGIVGAVGYGLQQVAYGFREASREAYNLDVSAKNAGMRVEDLSRLAGAMQINGSDGESARASIEGFSKALKDASSGNNQGLMSAFATIGAQIQKNKDGSVDTLKTLQEIARIFPTLRPEQQKSFSDAVGFTPEMLALMREGGRLTELLTKSDKFGLTIDPELNKELGDINGTMNELSASWDGLWQRSKNKALKASLSDGSVKDGLEGVTDLFTNGDLTGLSHAAGFVSTENANKIRKIQGDKEFYNSLPWNDRVMVNVGLMTDGVRKQYDSRYRATDLSQQLQGDIAAISRPQLGVTRGNVPYGEARNNAIGFRNHNPGNLRDASNTTGKNGGFSTFANDSDGMSAMARQLMLYGDRGNNTLDGIIHTYAPGSENNTRAYIDSVSKSTGLGERQRIDLHDPEVLKTLMAAMIKHESGTQPYTEDDLSNSIRTAIIDDRWKGLRNPEALAQQRYDIMSGGSSSGDRTPSILAAPQGKPDEQVIADNLSRSLKEVMSDQTLKLEITLVNDRGERNTYNVTNNGRITTPMKY